MVRLLTLCSNMFPTTREVSSSSHQHTAVVTTLFSDSYAAAVATLGYSLSRANTTARKLVLYFPDRISPAALCLATSTGLEPLPIDRIPPPHNGEGMNPHFMDQFTKLTLWTLDTIGVEALVYLDADTLVLRNFDELFTLPFNFAAVPDVFLDRRGFVVDFNAGVLLLKPDTRVHRAMLAALPTARFPPEYAEQAFLNQWFAPSAIRLPYIYNGNLAYKERSPEMWEGIWGEMKIIHYTIVKPFIGPKFKPLVVEELDRRVEVAARSHGGLFSDEMRLWGKYWDETMRTFSQDGNSCDRFT